MFQFSLHPGTYQVGPDNNLRKMLERLWIKENHDKTGTIYIISGFSNYNGGARFYKPLVEHTENGGKVEVYLGGSAAQRLGSKQVASALLECGAKVHIVNRKRLLHAKCYGLEREDFQSLVVSSGNFTGPGMSQNIEASIRVDNDTLSSQNFCWSDLVASMRDQDWQIHSLSLEHPEDPGWNLLYDEEGAGEVIEQNQLQTMILTLGHADTVRIVAAPGSRESLGTQYFWLSKDCFDFFPPLTIRNARGWKGTLATMINIDFKDLNRTEEVRVTFEAENNLDFRLGTGPLRNTGVCSAGDMAALTRLSDTHYEMRFFKPNSIEFNQLSRHAVNFIGNRGKRYGFIDNSQFFGLI